MGWVIAMTTIALFAIIPPASAESTSGAMQAFGLVGTWSEDCAAQGAARLAHAYPVFGNPTITITANNSKDGSGTLEVEIKSASKVTDEKLKLITVFTAKDGVRNPNPSETSATVYEKIGTKMRSGGMLLEKCLN